ncbi:MAG: hypothetical protein LRY50_07495 [Geovibrio sp.]|nr:hypothetical protein [Geovibrio sp.]
MSISLALGVGVNRLRKPVAVNNSNDPPITEVTGAMAFNGTNAHVIYPASSDYDVGTSADFSIEWNMWFQSANAFPRVFSIGEYMVNGGIKLGVSIETNTLYFWAGGGYVAALGLASYINSWNHFMIYRSSGTLVIKRNYSQIYSAANSTYIGGSSEPMAIGAENASSTASARFKGYITDFHFVKEGINTASNVSSKPASRPEASVAGTKLFLKALTDDNKAVDSSPSAHVASASTIAWRASTPWEPAPIM